MSPRALAIALPLALLAVSSTASADDPLGDDDELHWVPVLRLAAGPSLQVHPVTQGLFAFETTLGLSGLQGVTGGLGVNAEGGYLLEAANPRGALHAGHFTVGVGWGALGMALTYQPRFIIGSYDEALAIGMRNGVTFHGLADLASIELGHQFLSTRQASDDLDTRGLKHEVRLMLGVNPAALLYIAAYALDAAY